MIRLYVCERGDDPEKNDHITIYFSEEKHINVRIGTYEAGPQPEDKRDLEKADKYLYSYFNKEKLDELIITLMYVRKMKGWD